MNYKTKKITILNFISSARNLTSYLFIYYILRYTITALLHKDMTKIVLILPIMIYGAIFFFIAGQISTKMIIKEKGNYGPFNNIKFELPITFIFILLLEVLLL